MTLNLALKSYGGTIGVVGSTCKGTISAGSPTLVVNAVPATMAINDYVIVEIGAEAGVGVRGTMGVGGAWPALSYADVATMDADSSKAANTIAWVIANGNTYGYVSSVWTVIDQGIFGYYGEKALPESLKAQITNIVGTTITLDTNATAAATNANVYCDNEAYLTALGANPGNADTDWVIPAGTFAIGNQILLDINHDGLTLRGAGMNASEIFSPKGLPCAFIWSLGDTMTRHDYALRGNVLNNGFAFNHKFNSATTVDSWSLIGGNLFDSASNCIAYNLKATDVFQKAVWGAFMTNVTIYDCECYVTDGLQVYIAWYFGCSDSLGTIAVDRCKIYSPNALVKGFECFRSDGAVFTDCGGTNCCFSSNSSGSFLLNRYGVAFDCTKQLSFASFSNQEPVVNINSNIQPPNPAMLLGGEIRDPYIIVTGTFPFAPSGNEIPVAISIGEDNPNVSVTGSYPACDAGTAGYIEHPTAVLNGGTGVHSSGENTIVDGIRISGTNLLDYGGNIKLEGAGSIARNSVFDQFVSILGLATQTDNLTNSQWAAQCADVPVVPVSVPGTGGGGGSVIHVGRVDEDKHRRKVKRREAALEATMREAYQRLKNPSVPKPNVDAPLAITLVDAGKIADELANKRKKTKADKDTLTRLRANIADLRAMLYRAVELQDEEDIIVSLLH